MCRSRIFAQYPWRQKFVGEICRYSFVFRDAMNDMVRLQLRRVVAPRRSNNFHKGRDCILVKMEDAFGFVGNDQSALSARI